MNHLTQCAPGYGSFGKKCPIGISTTRNPTRKRGPMNMGFFWRCSVSLTRRVTVTFFLNEPYSGFRCCFLPSCRSLLKCRHAMPVRTSPSSTVARTTFHVYVWCFGGALVACGVIGSTMDSGSISLGSSPSRPADVQFGYALTGYWGIFFPAPPNAV